MVGYSLWAGGTRLKVRLKVYLARLVIKAKKVHDLCIYRRGRLLPGIPTYLTAGRPTDSPTATGGHPTALTGPTTHKEI